MIFTVPVANQNDANAYVIIMSCMCANFIESTTLVNFTISTDSKATQKTFNEKSVKLCKMLLTIVIMHLLVTNIIPTSFKLMESLHTLHSFYALFFSKTSRW